MNLSPLQYLGKRKEKENAEHLHKASKKSVNWATSSRRKDMCSIDKKSRKKNNIRDLVNALTNMF